MDESNDDEEEEARQKEPRGPQTTTSSKRPLSPLAMAAADWLEEEEEDDEWAQYWNRFEDGKRGDSATVSTTDVSTSSSTHASNTTDDRNLSTEERLERYLQSRGIDRQQQSQVEPELQRVLQDCKTQFTAQQVIDTLQQIEPLLSKHTQLGGTLYLEYAMALWKTEQKELALEICRAQRKNPHRDIVRRSKEIAADIVAGKEAPEDDPQSQQSQENQVKKFQWGDMSTWW